MTYPDLSKAPASYDIGTETYDDFDSRAVLRADTIRARELRLELCRAFGLDPDTATDELLTGAAHQFAHARGALHAQEEAEASAVNNLYLDVNAAVLAFAAADNRDDCDPLTAHDRDMGRRYLQRAYDRVGTLKNALVYGVPLTPDGEAHRD